MREQSANREGNQEGQLVTEEYKEQVTMSSQILYILLMYAFHS